MAAIDFDLILRALYNKQGCPTTAQTAVYITAKRNVGSDTFYVSHQERPAGVGRFSTLTRKELKVAEHLATIERLLELMGYVASQFPRPDDEDVYGQDACLVRVTKPDDFMDFYRDSKEDVRPAGMEEKKAMFIEAKEIMERWVA